MKREEACRLICAYLDGTISPGEREALDALLRREPEAAELFYDLALQHVLLHRIGKEEALRTGRFLRRAIAAAAAAVILAAGVFLAFALFPRYPAPRAEGGFVLEGGEKLGRGAVLVAREEARVYLGGYCTLVLSPGTRLSLAGEEGREAVFLHEGAVTCRVDSGRGGFTVQTRWGSVSVRGTVFTVRAGDDGMEVEVMRGAVAVSAGGEKRLLAAGEGYRFPPRPSLPSGGTPGWGPLAVHGRRLYVLSGMDLAAVDPAAWKITARLDLRSVLPLEEVRTYREHSLGETGVFVRGGKVYVVAADRLIVCDPRTLRCLKVVRLGLSAQGSGKSKEGNETGMF